AAPVAKGGDGAAQVLLGTIDVERHEQAPAFVGAGGAVAMKEVGGQRGEARPGEAVCDVLDVRHQPPPLPDDDHALAVGRRGLGAGKVALCAAAVGGELDHLSHGRDLYHPPSTRVEWL